MRSNLVFPKISSVIFATGLLTLTSYGSQQTEHRDASGTDRAATVSGIWLGNARR